MTIFLRICRVILWITFWILLIFNLTRLPIFLKYYMSLDKYKLHTEWEQNKTSKQKNLVLDLLDIELYVSSYSGDVIHINYYNFDPEEYFDIETTSDTIEIEQIERANKKPHWLNLFYQEHKNAIEVLVPESGVKNIEIIGGYVKIDDLTGDNLTIEDSNFLMINDSKIKKIDVDMESGVLNIENSTIKGEIFLQNGVINLKNNILDGSIFGTNGVINAKNNTAANECNITLTSGVLNASFNPKDSIDLTTKFGAGIKNISYTEKESKTLPPSIHIQVKQGIMNVTNK